MNRYYLFWRIIQNVLILQHSKRYYHKIVYVCNSIEYLKYSFSLMCQISKGKNAFIKPIGGQMNKIIKIEFPYFIFIPPLGVLSKQWKIVINLPTQIYILIGSFQIMIGTVFFEILICTKRQKILQPYQSYYCTFLRLYHNIPKTAELIIL